MNIYILTNYRRPESQASDKNVSGEETPNVHTATGFLSRVTSAHLIWERKLARFHLARSLNSREWRKPGHLLEVGEKQTPFSEDSTADACRVLCGHASEGTEVTGINKGQEGMFITET